MTSSDVISLMGGFWHHLLMSKVFFDIPKLDWVILRPKNGSNLIPYSTYGIYYNIKYQEWDCLAHDVSIMLSLFYLRALKKLDLDILDFRLFT